MITEIAGHNQHTGTFNIALLRNSVSAVWVLMVRALLPRFYNV